MATEVFDLATRVNRLFSTFHARGEPEPDVDDVARSVGAILGRTVSSATVTALRTDSDTALGSDTELLEALARHFHVRAAYLVDQGEEAASIDRQLRLLAASRDAGVQHLHLRGDVVDVDSLAQELSQLPDPDSGSS